MRFNAVYLLALGLLLSSVQFAKAQSGVIDVEAPGSPLRGKHNPAYRH